LALLAAATLLMQEATTSQALIALLLVQLHRQILPLTLWLTPQ
jgi:hypothetical protein